MTTKWKGQYTYGESYPETIQGTSIPFYLEWTEEEGIIKGTCVDEESKQVFDQPATLTGFLKKDAISFTLKYPYFWDKDEEHRIHGFKDLSSQEIHYTGTFVNDAFEGDWAMTVSYLDDEGQVTACIGIGTWTMEKEQ